MLMQTLLEHAGRIEAMSVAATIGAAGRLRLAKKKRAPKGARFE